MLRHSARLLLLTLLLAGCQQDSPSATPWTVDGSTIVMQEMVFIPDTIELAPDTPRTITVINEGGIVHDLVFDNGWSSGAVQPGRSVTVVLPGFADTTTGWCTVPGHRDAGMELTVTVTS